MLKAGKHNITAITRSDSTSTLPASVKVAKINYDDETSLADALKGQQFLVIALQVRKAPADLHSRIVHAAAKAGIAAFALLLWMNLTTAAPMRWFNYEFFVVQHIITFFGFIIATMMHLPSTALTSRAFCMSTVSFGFKVQSMSDAPTSASVSRCICSKTEFGTPP